jgi:succinate dehydrogenase / fumarate reductase cytochrome b subunit
LLYVLQMALGSEESFARCREFFGHPLVKLAVIGMIWLYAHHFFAGIRYLLLDVHVGIMNSLRAAPPSPCWSWACSRPS